MYFDYTATTPIDEEILNIYIDVQKKYYANTTSLHRLGQISNNIYEKMKAEVKEILQLSNHEVIFTSNATEANNLAILGLLENKKGKIITTKIEHPSVFEVFKKLEQDGYNIVYLDVDNNGIIDLNQLQKEMSSDVILVSIMWVNNIVGSIQPIKEVIKMVKKFPKAKFHCDCVQGICKIKPDFSFNDIDLITMSAHKFYGPKGIGMFLYKSSLQISKRLYGSNSQKGLKPGTFDLALVVGCCKALKKYYSKQEEHYSYVLELKKYIVSNITNKNIVINSNELCSPYIINISIPNIYGETVVHILEEKEIYVSTGSACSSKIKKPEKTVFAMTLNEKYANTTIRISLSHLTTQDEAKKLVEVLNKI